MTDILKTSWRPEIKYQGKIIQVVHQKMTNWEITKVFEYAERAPGVRIIIIDGEWKICVTKERRAELNNGEWGYDYRLPWGKVIDKLEEYNAFLTSWGNIEDAAQKAVKLEARQEVGIVPQEMNLLHVSECGATMKRDLYYYEVRSFEHHPEGQKLGKTEYIMVDRYTKEDVIAMCLDGKIQEDRTVSVLLKLLLKK